MAPKTPKPTAPTPSKSDLKDASKKTSPDPQLTTVDQASDSESSLESTKQTPGMLKRFADNFFKELSSSAQQVQGSGFSDAKPFRNETSLAGSSTSFSTLGTSGIDDGRRIPNTNWQRYQPTKIKTGNQLLDKALNAVQTETSKDLNQLQSNVLAGFSYFSKQNKLIRTDIGRIDDDMIKMRKNNKAGVVLFSCPCRFLVEDPVNYI